MLRDSDNLGEFYKTQRDLSPGTAVNERTMNNFTSPLMVNDSLENMTKKLQASPNNKEGNAFSNKLSAAKDLSASIEVAPNLRNSFDLNKFSATCASKFVIDNPKIEH